MEERIEAPESDADLARVEMLSPRPHGGAVVHDLTRSGHLWHVGIGPGPSYRVVAASFEASRLGALRTILEDAGLPLAIPPDPALGAVLAAGAQVNPRRLPDYVKTPRQLWRALRAETTPFSIRLIFDNADDFALMRGSFVRSAVPSGFLTIAYATESIAADFIAPVLAALNARIHDVPVFFHSAEVIVRSTIPEHPFTFEVERRIPYHCTTRRG
jgi:hypothetical protein